MDSGFGGIVAIIQCRFGSSRLPGKALRKIGQRPMLAHVIERAAAIGFPVLVATSENSVDDGVARTATDAGAAVFRGAEHDVLGRMSAAAHFASARIVIRITGDCPLLAPDVAREVVQLYIQCGHVIATNDTSLSGWPDGMDVEVFQAADLHEAAERATRDHDREHVTPWIRRAVPHTVLHCRVPGATRLKLSVDTDRDYERVKAVHSALADPGDLSAEATFAAARAVEAGMRAGHAAKAVPRESTRPGVILPPIAVSALRKRSLTPRKAAETLTDQQLGAIKGVGAATIRRLRKAFGGPA